MNERSRVDLHIHTVYSDGRDAPEDVLRRAAALGIGTVAITDHDSANGVRLVRGLARELGLSLIPAVEFTCRWDRCRTAPGKGDIDLLAYWVDIDDPDFCAFERSALDDIHERVADCCAFLTVGGYPVSIEALFARNPPYAGLMQLIHEVLDRGYASEWEAAFSLVLRGWQEVRLSRLTIERAIEQIHRAGGVAILAHPAAIACDGQWLQAEQMATLAEMGLDGLEIYHPHLDESARAHFGALAQRFQLLVSGGSDSHGWFDQWEESLGTQPVTDEMVSAMRARSVAWQRRRRERVKEVPRAADAAEAIRRWDLHARQFVSYMGVDGDPHRIVLLDPALFQLFPDMDGKRVLDAGCGEGYLSRKLARLGAHVTGADFSQEMLALARERTDSALGIRYVHGNCEQMDFLDPGTFDVVVSSMVLMDLSDHRAALESFYRLLIPDGVLIFSISHPCFSTPGCGWVKDGDGTKLYWKVDRYFEEGPFEQSWPPGAEEGTLLFHRTLSNYIRTLLRTGFQLLDVIEPKPAEEMLARYPNFWDDLRMSHFIVFKAQKR